MLAPLSGVAHIARVALSSPAHVFKAKKAIRRAFQTQVKGRGFSLVEALSTCPVCWGMTPVEALRWGDGICAHRCVGSKLGG